MFYLEKGVRTFYDTENLPSGVAFYFQTHALYNRIAILMQPNSVNLKFRTAKIQSIAIKMFHLISSHLWHKQKTKCCGSGSEDEGGNGYKGQSGPFRDQVG